MDLVERLPSTIKLVVDSTKIVQQYCDSGARIIHSQEHLNAASLLALCQSISLALNEIKDTLQQNGRTFTSSDGDESIIQPLQSILASCQTMFKVLYNTLQNTVPLHPNGSSSSSAKAKDLWPAADIASISSNISHINASLQLLVQALNLYVFT